MVRRRSLGFPRGDTTKPRPVFRFGGLILPMETRRGAHFWTPLDGLGLLKSGGAGIRTPVRDKIDHSVYVRIPPIEVSSRWPVDSPLLDKSFLISPAAGRRNDWLSRICDTLKAASGELL